MLGNGRQIVYPLIGVLLSAGIIFALLQTWGTSRVPSEHGLRKAAPQPMADGRTGGGDSQARSPVPVLGSPNPPPWPAEVLPPQAVTVEEVYALAEGHGISFSNKSQPKRIAESDPYAEWRTFLQGVKTDKRDADWLVARGTIVLQLKLMKKDGRRVYQGIHDALLSGTMRPAQQTAVIGLLGDIATDEALKTLSDLLRDGYEPKDHPDLRNAVPGAIASIAYQAYQGDRAAVAAQLEELLILSRGDPEVYNAAAAGLASIGTASGIGLLLQELASNKLYPERVRISQQEDALMQAAMEAKFQNPREGVQIYNQPEQRLLLLEGILAQADSPEGIHVLSDRLTQGAPGSLLTVAAGRALAHMSGHSLAADALLLWASEAPDNAAPLAGELFEIVVSDGQPEKIADQISNMQFRSKLVQNAVEQELKP